jgi:DNA-directed RNA polymerase subunit K/omega
MSDTEKDDDIFDEVKDSDSDESVAGATKDKKLAQKHENADKNSDNESDGNRKDYVDDVGDDDEEESTRKKNIDDDEADDDDVGNQGNDEIAEEIAKANEILKKKEREKKLIIAAENRRTSRHITLYELSAVIGTRATQIDKGSPVFVEFNDLVNSEDMAIREIIKKKSPLSIKRDTVRGVEIWEVNDMILPSGFSVGTNI